MTYAVPVLMPLPFGARISSEGRLRPPRSELAEPRTVIGLDLNPGTGLPGGYLATGSREQQPGLSKAFVESLRSVGYRVGENVVFEYRFANGEMERLPALAAELVRLGVDVISTGNTANTVRP